MEVSGRMTRAGKVRQLQTAALDFQRFSSHQQILGVVLRLL